LWQEKLADKKGLPKVLKLQKNFPCYNAVRSMGVNVGEDVVLVNPSEIVEIIKQIPKGKVITIVEICKMIAQKYHVQGCCSLTTGIFIMTAANAAEEAKQQGKQLEIPYWRTLKADGSLNEKYPGGALSQKKLLEEEGFTIIKKGKKYMVQEYENHVMKVK
jgi:alkylated DNA nucleotide flippase Atl1